MYFVVLDFDVVLLLGMLVGWVFVTGVLDFRFVWFGAFIIVLIW